MDADVIPDKVPDAALLRLVADEINDMLCDEFQESDAPDGCDLPFVDVRDGCVMDVATAVMDDLEGVSLTPGTSGEADAIEAIDCEIRERGVLDEFEASAWCPW